MQSGLSKRLIAACLVLTGCAMELPVSPESREINAPVVFGRALTLLTGETSRKYQPQVRFFELMNRQTLNRYNVQISSDDKVFVLQLPTGEYSLTRVQISEGPFMSMAELTSTFNVGSEPITYLGTWRFGVDSPRYERMVVLSIVGDKQGQAQAQHALVAQYPALDGQTVASASLDPQASEARLYEVMPYPRYPTYFRRHW